LTIGAPNRVWFPSVTTTITNFTNISASASSPVMIETGRSSEPADGNFCGFQGLTFTGGGTFSATIHLASETIPDHDHCAGRRGSGGQRVISG
jgi:hypothetical protein